jgi:hypothetical protein
MIRYQSLKEAYRNINDLELEVYEFDLKKNKENLFLLINDTSQIEQIAKKNKWEEVKNKKGFLKYYIDNKNQKDYYVYL